MGLISLILPVTADTQQLDRTVLHAQYEAGLWPTEIVLVGMGGRDLAAEAAALKVRAVTCDSDNRAAALNAGAAAAKGEVLLFLAPDCLMPRRFAESIWQVLRDPRLVGGAFDFEFDPQPFMQGMAYQSLQAVRVLNRIRFRWTGNFLLEQGIFVRREVFDAIGGFKPVGRMEDLYFSRAMKRRGRTAVLGPPMLASPARFLRGGIIRQFIIDLLRLGLDGFGSGQGVSGKKSPQQNATFGVF